MFNLLKKNNDSVPQSFPHEGGGGRTKAQNVNKILLLCVYKSFSRNKDTDCTKDVKLIQSILVFERKKHYSHTIFLWSLVPPGGH